MVSCFTSSYVFYWSKIFQDVELKFPPLFDGRVILYPSFENLKDYFSWRQVDCHINNLYNTTFWALVLIGKLTTEQAHNKLKGTFSKDKNEILFKDFEINYNCIEGVYKRGTIIFRIYEEKKKNNIIRCESEILINDLNLGINSKEYIGLADKLFLNDESYMKLLDVYFEKNIYLTHEDLIQIVFWEKYDLIK